MTDDTSYNQTEFATIVLTCKPCIVCGKRNEIEVLKEDYDRYRNGAFVQVAFPEMPAPQREMIISGTCPPCFNILWPSEDE